METNNHNEVLLTQEELQEVKDVAFNEGVEAVYDLLKNSIEGTVKIGWDEMKGIREGIFSDIRDLYK